MSAATRKWDRRAKAVVMGQRKREAFKKQDKLTAAVWRVTR